MFSFLCFTYKNRSVTLTYLRVSHSNKNVVKELLNLLVEESGCVDGQLSQYQHLYNIRQLRKEELRHRLIKHIIICIQYYCYYMHICIQLYALKSG